ncbi:phosphomevalonate kinase, peroxisomal isoform X1 [Cryptomeria japonica]|uniref:phosphomevalonate kinase, peroxisomal isoform X1 n=1 Tax=Cryptomeria japonica TaxID=3369 RepID=UPI0027DA3114|nr:phosphomevalonate kinase, peroxisomal isoform X1 [Cryptomeria japonica]
MLCRVASAPGKVLITGAYLILEKPNPGVVLTTTARFYAIVKPLHDSIDTGSWAWLWTDVKLSSPQLSKEGLYKLSLKTLSLQNVSSLSGNGNPFVEQAVQYAVAAAKANFENDNGKHDTLLKLLVQGFDITILGSNDFYSYRKQIDARGLPLTSETLASLPAFSSINVNTSDTDNSDSSSKVACSPELAKTGLGSSAAMTTAVVAGILHYLGVVNLPTKSCAKHADKMTDADLDLVHAVSQTAHCVAQGKTGSGFDVSAAVYGSQRYVRFSPDILSAAQVSRQSKSFLEAVTEILNCTWDNERIEYALPPFMALLLGEPGYGGSCTPSMVGAVQSWRKRDSQNSQVIWKKLAEANMSVERELLFLKHIAEEQPENYKKVIENCSKISAEKWMDHHKDDFSHHATVKALLGARQAMLEVRNLLRHIGEAAGVPIEPESQTCMLDSTMSMEGVLLAGVPGAGGFDAIFAITLGTTSRDHVAHHWSTNGVLPLLVTEDPRGVTLEDGDPREREIANGIHSINLK